MEFNELTEKFTDKHRVLAQKFQCGNFVIDNFLKSDNALDISQGVTYVMLSDEKDCIIGFYNIEVGRVDRVEYIGDTMSASPMGGTVNINYLAIDKEYQSTEVYEINGQKSYFGDLLLRDCENRIARLKQNVGISFITLYSTERGYHFYHDRNNYEDFEDDMNTVVRDSDISSYRFYKCINDSYCDE